MLRGSLDYLSRTQLKAKIDQIINIVMNAAQMNFNIASQNGDFSYCLYQSGPIIVYDPLFLYHFSVTIAQRLQ